MSKTKWAGRDVARLRAETLATYGTTCHLCGKPGANSTDHLIPRSQGGANTLDNLRPAHYLCNIRRGTLPVATYIARYHPDRAAGITNPGLEWFNN
ncbi:HNH endonuclease signature motif containing protein [Canibacter zhoujuaniae]|uniref:HNH endonuclease n=1 Tax=Canibacter zhoujuaniae TaxID=2708343 RepID=UPI00141E40DD